MDATDGRHRTDGTTDESDGRPTRGARSGGSVREAHGEASVPGASGTANDRENPRVETLAFESQGVRCEADLHLPADGTEPWPTVVMAHGFGGARSWGLAPFARRFAAAGFAAFVFDYRHLGGSEGTPRRLVDTDRQLADWTAALEHVRSMEAVDDRRIALWGTSFGGGHALVTASRESVAAVVAQVPFVDGRATVAHVVGDDGPIARARKIGLAVADRASAVVGRGPVELPMASEPGDGGLLDTPGALAGVRSVVPDDDDLVNRTPARVVLDLPRYRPLERADRIDAPVHVVVAEADRLLPSGPTERLLDRLADPTEFRIPAGHFDVHHDPWVGRVADEQVAFLEDALDLDA